MLEEPRVKTQNKRKDKYIRSKELSNPFIHLWFCNKNSYKDVLIPKWKLEKQLYFVTDGWEETFNKNAGVELRPKIP